MTHSADASFFDSKKSWSKRKDLLLSYYLKPYLAKVSSIRKPILIVDAFAGPGVFEDGQPGSPSIIAGRVAEALKRPRCADIQVLCVERDPELFQRLNTKFQSNPRFRLVNGDFLGSVPLILDKAAGKSVFIYIDPYAIKGLEWSAIQQLLNLVAEGQSVEILMNFNAPAFGRRARALLGRTVPQEVDDKSDASVDELSSVVGGDWWESIFETQGDFASQVQLLADRFCDQIRTLVPEVCSQSIFEHYRQAIPKYTMIFASRHRDTRELMNDAMASGLEKFAEETEEPGCLFEMRPESVAPDASTLDEILISALDRPMRRKELIYHAMQHQIGQFKSGTYKTKINQLVKRGAIRTTHHNFRLNDDAMVMPAE